MTAPGLGAAADRLTECPHLLFREAAFFAFAKRESGSSSLPICIRQGGGSPASNPILAWGENGVKSSRLFGSAHLGDLLQCGDIYQDNLAASRLDQLLATELAHHADRRLDRGARHVGDILARERHFDDPTLNGI